MKQFDENILCYFCWGCNKLEEENFEGRKTCRGFMEGIDATEYFKKLKKGRYK